MTRSALLRASPDWAPASAGEARKRSGVAALAALSLLAATPALADSAQPAASLANTQLKDPAKEAQARALMATLRCLVCQGQAISDSDAEMAGDMRSLVRRRIADGERPEQVRKWLIARYGDYVTYDPPFSIVTAPLWLMPLLLLAIGGWLARGAFKRRRG
ncbi:cytochrome c-type biogenesis protein [Sphingomonas sp. UYAg733]